jgi:hypothetical protein
MTKSNFAEAVWSAVMHSVIPNTVVLLGWPSDWRQLLKRETNPPFPILKPCHPAASMNWIGEYATSSVCIKKRFPRQKM